MIWGHKLGIQQIVPDYFAVSAAERPNYPICCCIKQSYFNTDGYVDKAYFSFNSWEHCKCVISEFISQIEILSTCREIPSRLMPQYPIYDKSTMIQFWWEHTTSNYPNRRWPSFMMLYGVTRAPFYWHGLTLIPAWISNYTHYNMWDDIYLFLNFNGATVEV